MLHQALSTVLKDSHLEEFVALKPVECLSLCPRPCGVAISSPGAWTYLFGDQAPEVNQILAKGVRNRTVLLLIETEIRAVAPSNKLPQVALE